jgi:hypothetical protein
MPDKIIPLTKLRGYLNANYSIVVAQSTIYNWCKRGILPDWRRGVRVFLKTEGKNIRFTRESWVKEFLSEASYDT